jgi:hypothetical protein
MEVDNQSSGANIYEYTRIGHCECRNGKNAWLSGHFLATSRWCLRTQSGLPGFMTIFSRLFIESCCFFYLPKLKRKFKIYSLDYVRLWRLPYRYGTCFEWDNYNYTSKYTTRNYINTLHKHIHGHHHDLVLSWPCWDSRESIFESLLSTSTTDRACFFQSGLLI